MKKYKMVFEVCGFVTVEVEAAHEDDAFDKLFEKAWESDCFGNTGEVTHAEPMGALEEVE